MTGKLYAALLGTALGWAALARGLNATPIKGVQWTACDETYLNFTLVPIECGNLTVPLDYTQPDSGETLELRLLRVPALKQPAQGSIIFHFGGPDPMGQLLSMAGFGEIYQVYTGQTFDLVSWEQRGTGQTTPFKCANTSAETTALLSRGNMAVTTDDEIDVARNWAYSAQVADSCLQYAGERAGNLSGTAATVRDVFSIVDALGGDKRLRFYGISYGTLVGQTAAAMFPDRIEKMVLDGVMNAHQYWDGFDWELSAEADDVFSAFLRTCYEAPEVCPLAISYPNSTAEEIEARVYKLIDDRKRRPVPFLDERLAGQLLDQNFLKTMIRPALYDPYSFVSLATLLSLLLSDDLETFIPAYIEAQGGLSPIFTGGVDNDASFGIYCLDKHPPATTLDALLPELDKFSNASRLVGDLLSSAAHICAQWQLPAVERYSAGFHDPIDTAPLLILNNEYDIVTPYTSAKNASASFPGSALVKFRAIGHATTKQPSLCIPRMVRAYFENGTLPEEGVECAALQHPWEPQSWRALFPELGYERKNLTGTG